MDYYFGGKGSFKSCTKKAKLQFSTHVRDELEYLDPVTPTNMADDLDQYIWCMEATIYDLIRDNIDLNHITEKEKYSVSYHLRKNKDNHFFLESKIWFNVKNLTSEYALTESSLFFDITPTFQRIIKGRENMSEDEKLAELEEIEMFFGDDDHDEYNDYDDCEEFNL